MALGGIAWLLIGTRKLAAPKWRTASSANVLGKFFCSSPSRPSYSAAAWRSFHSCSRESSTFRLVERSPVPDAEPWP